MEAKAKKLTSEEALIEKMKDDIVHNNRESEIRFIKIIILNAVGPQAYKSWFEDRVIHIRSGWYVIPVASQWVKDQLMKKYSAIIKNNKIILQVGD